MSPKKKRSKSESLPTKYTFTEDTTECHHGQCCQAIRKSTKNDDLSRLKCTLCTNEWEEGEQKYQCCKCQSIYCIQCIKHDVSINTEYSNYIKKTRRLSGGHPSLRKAKKIKTKREKKSISIEKSISQQTDEENKYMNDNNHNKRKRRFSDLESSDSNHSEQENINSTNKRPTVNKKEKKEIERELNEEEMMDIKNKINEMHGLFQKILKQNQLYRQQIKRLKQENSSLKQVNNKQKLSVDIFAIF